MCFIPAAPVEVVPSGCDFDRRKRSYSGCHLKCPMLYVWLMYARYLKCMFRYLTGKEDTGKGILWLGLCYSQILFLSRHFWQFLADNLIVMLSFFHTYLHLWTDLLAATLYFVNAFYSFLLCFCFLPLLFFSLLCVCSSFKIKIERKHPGPRKQCGHRRPRPDQKFL